MSDTKDMSLSKRWLMATVIYLVMFAAFANQFKAPGLFGQIIPQLGFNEMHGFWNVGWVMSMFSVMGVIMAFPAAGIVQKFGIKKTLTVTVVCLVVGSVIGALTDNAYVLLFSRFIEGSGIGFLSVCAPSALAVLIPEKQRGLAYGIQGITFPLGTVIGMNVATIIGTAMGWRAAWWAGGILAFVVGILLIVAFKLPEQLDHPGARKFNDIDESVKPDWRGIIVVGIAYCIWQIIWVGAVNSFFATFLQQTFGMPATEASFMTTITSIMMIVLGPITGIVSDKLGTRKWLIVFCFVGSAVCLWFGWDANLTLVWLFLILEGIFAPCITTGVMAIVPSLAKRPDKVSLGMATVTCIQKFGMVVGSAIFTPIVAAAGSYSAASQFFLVPCSIVGALIVIFFVREKRVRKNQSNAETSAAAKTE